MYEELVQRMREIHQEEFGDAWDFAFACQQTMHEAADAIEELNMKLHGDEAAIVGMKREIERMVVAGRPRWIPVTERLPESGARCLVTRFDFVTNTPFIDLLWFDNSWWDRLNSGEYAVTHWMPLPPAPEPQKEEA